MKHLSASAVIFALGACGAQISESDEGYGTHRIEDAREDARSNLDGMSYQDMHGSLDCAEDCSGHDAGYQCAQDNGVEDASECGGNSMSFIEGCEAYANDLSDEADEGADQYEADGDDWE